jgi:hypothetical protein
MTLMPVSERRVCRVLGQHRSTQRKTPRGADDEAALTEDMGRTHDGRKFRILSIIDEASREWLALHCYPTLDHSGLGFSALLSSGGLVSPAEFDRMIGGIFPIALCGRSSL